MENKTMKISTFIEKFNAISSDTAKAQLVKKIIKTNYAGIATKRAVLQNAIEKSVVNKGSIVYVDSLVSKVNFAVSVVLLYTILEFDKKEDGSIDVFGGYDLLMKNGIFDMIITFIGESEIDELAGVNASLLDNFHTENSSTQATLIRCINNGLAAITVGLDRLLSNVDKTLSDEKVIASINDVLKKYKK